MSSSGNVFLRCQSETQDDETSGALRLWSQGILYDNVTENGVGSAKLGCTEEPGLAKSHGWSAVHSVLWNYRFDRSSGSVDKPPTAQNYAIGRGPLASRIGTCDAAADGFVEQKDATLRQESLYEAQLCDRLRP
jgi:hypothetical protein